MSYTTLDAEIRDGQVTVREPDKLPRQGRALLVILEPPLTAAEVPLPRTRVSLPLRKSAGISSNRSSIDAAPMLASISLTSSSV